MKLIDLSPAERRDLAEKVKANPLYLWQCATGRRTPSPKLAKAIVEADARFTLDEIYSPSPTSQPAEAAHG